jgi:hypothetical protein
MSIIYFPRVLQIVYRRNVPQKWNYFMARISISLPRKKIRCEARGSIYNRFEVRKAISSATTELHMTLHQ